MPPETAVTTFVEAYLGSNGPATRAELHEALRDHGLAIDDRKLRLLLRRMVRDGVPVGSGEPGYYLCRTSCDLAAARRQLRSRICRLSRRDKELREAYWRRHGGQVELSETSLIDAAVDAIAVASAGDDDDGD